MQTVQVHDRPKGLFLFVIVNTSRANATVGARGFFFFKVGENAQRLQINGGGRKLFPSSRRFAPRGLAA